MMILFIFFRIIATYDDTVHLFAQPLNWTWKEINVNDLPVTKKCCSIPSCIDMLDSTLTNLMVTSVSSSKCRHKLTISGKPPKFTMS